MILARNGRMAALVFRQRVPGIRRVLITRTDGIPLYDDASLAERDMGAAITATLLGIGSSSAAGFGLGSVAFSVVYGDFGCLFVYPIDARHALAVIAETHVDTVLLGTVAYEMVGQLAERARGGQVAG